MKKLILPAMTLAISLASIQLANATVTPPLTVPDGGTTLGLLALALVGVGAIARKPR